ncbi:MAG: radical SAM protein [Bacteroidales bacterium]|nr:radical SAM protein [Bacteroidales bacterium]
MEKVKYIPLYSHSSNVYNLKNFSPRIIDKEYLDSLNLRVLPSQEAVKGLEEGSKLFIQRFNNGSLIPHTEYAVKDMDPATIKTEIHNYTGHCPTLTYEINPVMGCGVGCQYCLVSDGVHEQSLVAINNYSLYVRQLLEEKNGKNSENVPHYYYFSPKTEAFQEATLYTGIAHSILHEFIEHFKKNPDSKARMFIASKAGVKHLTYSYNGETVLDLLRQLKGKVQFNTSVSIMPTEFRDILEPFAAPISERLEAVKLCQNNGILANSALVQPIFTPYLTDNHIKEFFDMLHAAGIINYKPEFLTACVENIAMLGQYLGYFDKALEKKLYEDYLQPENADHRKQRGRTAPSRELSIANIRKMMSYTDTLGMSTSICYWVRMQLGISQEMIPLINRNGFQCLGYQSKLFE